MDNILTITDKAKNKLLLLRTDENKDTSFNLRVLVEGGGCAGLNKSMKFDSEIKEKDTIVDFSEIKILIDKKSLLYLIGTELDYDDRLNGKGFIWNIPQATRTCSCGDSFSI